MNKTALIGAAVVAALSCSPAIAKIPFNGTPVANASLPRIGNFTTPSNKQLYVEANRTHWYRADLASACPGLRQAKTIQIKMSPPAKLNSSSTVMANGQSCPVASVARVEGPEKNMNLLRYQAIP